MLLSVPREIGPLGTASRVLAGTGVVAVAVAGEGVGWWDLAAAVTLLPAIALGATYLPRARGPAATTAVAIAAVAGLGTLLTFISPVNRGAILLFIGLSMLLAAIRGDRGCELLSVANVVRGRRVSVGPLFRPVDATEARH